MKAIPTVYRGIQMRSRLEAKWAFIFDQLGWSWEYEPIDLEGWIPDFVIRGAKPILVDVKPAFEFPEETGKKILKAIGSDDEKYELVILGAGPIESEYNPACIGWMLDEWSGGWDHAVPMYPTKTPRVYGLASDIEGYYADRITGNYDGDHDYKPLELEDWLIIWAKATNAMQWKAPR